MIHSYIRRAFSMLELIFVIVILGIVSSIGASIIANVFDGYIVQRALHNATVKTDLAAKQIAARLSYRINNTVIGKHPNTGAYKSIINLFPADVDNTVLEWIGYDNDSFSATAIPGWSGFCDIDTSSKANLSTPGSNLANTTAIIGNLGGTAATDTAVVFNGLTYFTGIPYEVSRMGYTPGLAPLSISPVTFASNTNMNFTNNDSKTVYDQYKLAWSAYAIVPTVQIDDPNTDIDESKLFDLNLHYDYQPWNGIQYTNGKIKTLVENVTVFKFKGVGNTIRFKICVQEKISATETVNICKEKVVIR